MLKISKIIFFLSLTIFVAFFLIFTIPQVINGIITDYKYSKFKQMMPDSIMSLDNNSLREFNISSLSDEDFQKLVKTVKHFEILKEKERENPEELESFVRVNGFSFPDHFEGFFRNKKYFPALNIDSLTGYAIFGILGFITFFLFMIYKLIEVRENNESR